MSGLSKTISNRRVRIALVGCGRISRRHIDSIIQHNTNATLVALCDIQQQRLQNAQALIEDNLDRIGLPAYHIEHYTRFNELLEAIAKEIISVDLIVLATPSGLHSRQTIAAAGVGVHVCTEKPMATRLSDGLAMVQACDDANVRLFVVKQNRFNSTVQVLKRHLVAGRFGNLSMVVANVFWQRPQSYYDQDSWRGTWEFDGGALMNQASHYVDLLDWLIGPIESVSAATATLGRTIEVEDTAALHLRWRNGALGTMGVTMLTYPENFEGSLTLLGAKGTVKISGPALNIIEHWQFADQLPEDSDVLRNNYACDSIYGSGHASYYSNMIKTLKGEEDPLCDGREGLRSLELLIGAYRSARDGRTIHLPLEY